MKTYPKPLQPITAAPLLAFAALMLGLMVSAQADEVDSLVYLDRLGFTDARHTSDGGDQHSRPLAQSDTGYVLGISHLYIADSTAVYREHVQTGWIGRPDGRTIRVGFYDALHTRDDGRQETYPLFINRGGVSVGYSQRFSGSDEAGTSAWLADRHGTMLKLGFYDAQHTGYSGAKHSMPVALNNRNKLLGYSIRFAPSGITAWVANSVGQISRTGLIDAAHTGSSGEQMSMPVSQNDAGYVTGFSRRYAPAYGQTAWVRDLQKNVRAVGLYTGVHRSAAGASDNEPVLLSENGYIAGMAKRFSGDAVVGQTLWLAGVSSPATPIGFYDAPVHMPSPGVASGEIYDISETGYVVGMSQQYSPGSTDFENDWRNAGATAWIVNPRTRTTVRIGYYGAAYTHPAGTQSSFAIAVNDHGLVVGTSAKFDPADRLPYQGTDAWVADERGTYGRIGLYDGLYTSSEGHNYSHPLGITNSGFAWGVSNRYTSWSRFGDLGQTAWIYDHNTGTHTKFVLSTAADGYAHSDIDAVLEDGTVIGSYSDYTPGRGGSRAFIHIPGQGTYPIEDLLDVTLAEEGWTAIRAAPYLSPNGYLAVSAEPMGGSGTAITYQHVGVFLARRTGFSP